MMALVCSVGIVKVSPNAFESLSPESVAKSPSEVIRQKIDRLRVMVVILHTHLAQKDKYCSLLILMVCNKSGSTQSIF